MDMIRCMDLQDLAMVLDWAAAEGWNPGLDDAKAFHAADPEGFLLKTVDGVPAATVSVVNHSPGFAFLGLYITARGLRGQGHGRDVWQAGLAHAGSRTVGLDGVPDQQANYARSGFGRAGRTVRYAGRLAPAAGLPPVRGFVEPDMLELLRLDAIASGIARPGFMRPWLRGTARRRTAIVEEAGGLAYATVRDCRYGTKIGPLAARSERAARALIGALSDKGDVVIDVPEDAVALSGLLGREGFTPVFETARMYLGPPPATDPPPYSAIATLELG